METLARELRDLAAGIAREAGALLADRFAGERTGVGTKSTATDMVSDADRDAERLIVDRILLARPGDAILGEEGGARAGSSGVRWVIDPLDGTTNFLYGIPMFAVSIGAEFDGAPLAGAIYDVTRGVLFSAGLGLGATEDGRPLHVSVKAKLATALIGTGFSYDAGLREHQGAVAAHLLPRVRDLRRSGSACLDLCAVAAGRFDGYYEAGLQHWDLAAGRLLVTEAGGRCGDLAVGPGPVTVAAGPALYPLLAGLIETASSGPPA